MKNKTQSQIFHFDLYGKREDKYNFLKTKSVKDIVWNDLKPDEKNCFFVNKNFEGLDEYEKGFMINDLFYKGNSGIKTHRDDLVYEFDEKELLDRINIIKDISFSDEDVLKKLNLKSNRDWHFPTKRKLIINEINSLKIFIKIVEYRPFDYHFCFYNKEAIDYHRYEIMHNMFYKNVLFMSSRKSNNDFNNVFVSKYLGDIHTISDQTYCYPLYLYPDTSGQQSMDIGTVAGSERSRTAAKRTSNLNSEIVKQIADGLGLTFTNEKEIDENNFAPIDILDYIYAVLHSPSYREKYKEFLKIDFPRVPYPKDKDTFWQLVALGSELRQIHLLESPIVEKRITTYPQAGTNEVDKPRYDNGKVWINDTQFFDGVPEIAWNFYIGGYQPAQKWLKDRKGRALSFEDILHYQKIIVALWETDRLMKEIDNIGLL